MLIAIWNMLSTGALYSDPGDDFYARLNPDKAKNRAIDQLRKMGYDVTLKPLGRYRVGGNLRIRGHFATDRCFPLVTPDTPSFPLGVARVWRGARGSSSPPGGLDPSRRADPNAVGAECDH